MENFKVRKLHVIKNGVKCEMSPNEFYAKNEGKSEDDVKMDKQWYLDNGWITLDDFEKTHPL